MKSMFMKLGGRKSSSLPLNRSFDEKIFNSTIDLLEVFVKKGGDPSFGAEAPGKDVDAVVTNVFSGELLESALSWLML